MEILPDSALLDAHLRTLFSPSFTSFFVLFPYSCFPAVSLFAVEEPEPSTSLSLSLSFRPLTSRERETCFVSEEEANVFYPNLVHDHE